jgi:hypothetical protein
MGSSIIQLSVSIAAGILCALSAIIAPYILNTTTPKSYSFTIMGIVIIISYIIGLILTIITYFTSPNRSKMSLGQVFIKSLFLPLMTGIMIFTFAIVPVLLGVIPPKFQTYPGEGMTIIGAFRGIPESMMNTIGDDAIPIAEMFYAFWGGLYGQTIASGGL